MSLIQIGLTALRAPDGAFLPAVPIYKEVSELTAAGLTVREDKALDEFAELAAHRFKQYIDECKAAGDGL